MNSVQYCLEYRSRFIGFQVAPILPSNLDGKRRLAIQESDAANHAIRKEMVGPNGTRTIDLPCQF